MIVNKLRYVAADYIASQAWLLKVYTDIPGPARALLCTISFPAKSERGLVRRQLPTNARTVSIEREILPDPNGDLEMYDIQWYRRPMGGASGWSWWADPDIPQTPETWQTWSLGVDGTSDQFHTEEFPIEGTSDQFRTEPLGIDESGTEWRFLEISGGES